MRKVLQLLLCVVSFSMAVPTAWAADEKEKQPTGHNGSSSSAMVAGFTDALDSVGIKDASIDKAYSLYQETYGPAMSKMNFNVRNFVRGDPSNPSPIWLVMKLLMVAVISAVFVRVAFLASKGQASFSDLGWSMSKSGIAAVLVLFPGILYALIIVVPTAFCGLLVSRMNDPASGNNAVTVEARINEGGRAAAAHATGTIATLDDDFLVAFTAQKFNVLVTRVVAPKWREVYGLNLIQIPSAVMVEADVDGKKQQVPSDNFTYSTEPFSGLANLWRENGSFKAVTVSEYKKIMDLSAKGNETLHWNETVKNKVKSDLMIGFRAFVKTWKHWPSDSVMEPIKIHDLQSEAEKDIFDDNDPDSQASVLATLGLDVHSHLDKKLWNEIFLAGITERARQPLHKAKLAGAAEAKKILEDFQAREQGWIEKIQRYIAGVLINGIVHGLGFIWLIVVDVMMLNLILMLPLWIHPKTEPGVVKVFKKIGGVAIFAPLYLISLFLIDKVGSVFFGLSGGSMLAFGPFKLIFSIAALILPPFLAIAMAFVLHKVIFEQASLLGGVMKGVLSGVGTTVAMAVPALRGVGMAAAASVSGAAGRTEARADATSDPIKKEQLKAVAKRQRSRAHVYDVSQKILGQAFGADEKYMSSDKTRGQNARGMVAATGMGMLSGVNAAAKGTGASGVFEGVAHAGERMDKIRREFSGEKKSEDSSVDRQVQAQIKAAEKLTEAFSSATKALSGTGPQPHVQPSAQEAKAPELSPGDKTKHVLRREAGAPTSSEEIPPQVTTPLRSVAAPVSGNSMAASEAMNRSAPASPPRSRREEVPSPAPAAKARMASMAPPPPPPKRR